MKNRFTSILFAAIFGCVSIGSASVVETGGSIAEPNGIIAPLNYTATTVGGPTFNRPYVSYDTGMPTGDYGTFFGANSGAVPFDMVQFSVATTGVYNFLSTTISPVGWDNYLLLYSGSFTSTSAQTGLIFGNDDLGSTTANIGKSGFNYTLQTGVSYFLVTTGFQNTNTGSFANSITLVPEPGTWVMIGASVVGLGATQRFRRRKP